MNDDQLDRLVRSCAPRRVERVGEAALHLARHDLLEQIMATPDLGVTPAPDPATSPALQPALELGTLAPARPERGGRRSRRLLVAAAAAALVAVVALPAYLTSGPSSGPGGAVVPAAGHGTDGPRPPRVVPAGSTWRVEHLSETSATERSVGYASAAGTVELTWYPADQYASYREDRSHVSAAEPVSALGLSGSLYTYGGNDFALLLPAQGDTFLEVRGSVGDRTAFEAFVAGLHPVSEGVWQATLGGDVVTPEREDDALAAMLGGVPVPPGFDRATLTTDRTNDAYQFGAHVAGAVTCAWLGAYATARDDGDEAGLAAARDALRGVPTWPVVTAMQGGGDYPEVLVEVVDSVLAGADLQGTKAALGC